MGERECALVVGAGHGLSAAIARCFAGAGMHLGLAARRPEKLADLCSETGAEAFECDVASEDDVVALFARMKETIGAPSVVVFNPGKRVRGPIAELDAEEVRQALMVTSHGGFLVGREAARGMLAQGRGTILFTGASASVKGYPQSASFAMGKFALRGLAQSMARELQPRNIHVAHFLIDGAILNPGRSEPDDKPDSMLSPDSIAATYLAVHRQHRSAWSFEIDLRPWTETF